MLEHFIGWKPPPSRMVKLNVDGSAKGTPGDSAAGALCRDANGTWCFGFTVRLGVGTALRAEFFAVWKGLQLLWNRGFKWVQVESDSQLAVLSYFWIKRYFWGTYFVG
ncbi:hypothetical protein SLA2020_368790 [Shorea laevis]